MSPTRFDLGDKTRAKRGGVEPVHTIIVLFTL